MMSTYRMTFYRDRGFILLTCVCARIAFSPNDIYTHLYTACPGTHTISEILDKRMFIIPCLKHIFIEIITSCKLLVLSHLYSFLTRVFQFNFRDVYIPKTALSSKILRKWRIRSSQCVFDNNLITLDSLNKSAIAC